nr:HlyD family secretion protein [Acetatifactor sp.]
DSLSEAIQKYNDKIAKLNSVKQCVTEKKNTFGTGEAVYYSMVDSYLASYNYTSQQYDNQVNEYQRQINAYEEQIKNADGKPATGGGTISGNDFISANAADNVGALKKQRDELIAARDLIKKEKNQSLLNLELQQIAAIEQQISGYSDTVLSLETNLTSAELQMDAIKGADNEAKKEITILTEKGNVDAEILACKEKLKEYEAYLKSYDIQNDNCTIRANQSGYFYAAGDFMPGSYVQEGSSIGAIYPEEESRYYAELYVENSDIAKMREGQEVKFEIAAYPSGEYGYFKGTVENIARDISVDQSAGYAYYLVKVKCDNMTLKGKDGEEASLKNGMACQSKIVVDEKHVLTYLLEKIDLLD